MLTRDVRWELQYLERYASLVESDVQEYFEVVRKPARTASWSRRARHKIKVG